MAAPSWVDVKAQYAGDLAAALAAASSGTVLYLPTGVYSLSTAAGAVIDKPSITVRGDGREFTFIQPYNGGGSSCGLTIAEDWVTVMDCTIGNSATPSSGSGDGIRIGSGSKVVSFTRIFGVEVRNMGRHGINACPGHDGATTFDTAVGAESGFGGSGAWFDSTSVSTFTDVLCSGNRSCGMRLWAPANLALVGGMVLGNGLTGLRARDWRSGVIQGLEASQNCQASTETTWEGQVFLSNCQGLAITGSQCEQFAAFTNKNGLVLDNGIALLVAGNMFVNQTADAGTVGILVADGSRGCTLTGNKFTSLGKTIVLRDATTTGNLVGPQFVDGASVVAKSEMTVLGANGNTAWIPFGTYADGNLNIVGGLLLPPISWSTNELSGNPTLQRGVIVCDSGGLGSHMIKYFDGTSWYQLSGTLVP